MSDDDESGDTRRAALRDSLGRLRARIAKACADAGRDPESVTLVAVTKTYPASDVAALAYLGVLDVGESKDQEARDKVAALPALAGERAAAVRWHFVGRLQTNKARSVASYARAVHSVDRVRLADALGQAAEHTGPVDEALEIFVQVSLDGDPQRGGAAPGEISAVADAVTAHRSLRLRGLMAVPPLGTDADAAFGALAALSLRLRERHPGADALSAGMSDDLEAAVRHGATHLRIGTALLGRRPPHVR